MSLSRPLLIGLIASAALNVFLIGGVAGMAYVRLSQPPPAVAPAPEPRTVYVPQAAPTPPPADPATPSRPARPAPVVTPPQPEQTAERQARPPLWTAGDRLSQQSRRALRQALHAANQKNKPITRQARAERQAALDALASPGFDPGEVSRRLASARSLDGQARANVEAALAAYAATLSPQERTVLADGLTRIYTPRKALRQAQE